MFSIDTYNRLPLVRKASGVFNEQLKSSGLTLDSLLSELTPLFCEGDNDGRYGVWLLHHHFDLNAGERMVEKGDTTEPLTEVSTHIVAERWNDEGEELEYTYVEDIDDVPPPPSAEFMRKFKVIMNARKIDTLGVCYAPSRQELEKVKEGYTFLETTNHGGRKQVVSPVPVDDPYLQGENIFPASWTMSGDWGYSCNHNCTGCYYKPEPKPKPKPKPKC